MSTGWKGFTYDLNVRDYKLVVRVSGNRFIKKSIIDEVKPLLEFNEDLLLSKTGRYYIHIECDAKYCDSRNINAAYEAIVRRFDDIINEANHRQFLDTLVIK